jgi:RimJ/RimL family protein N-acetyltransferase
MKLTTPRLILRNLRKSDAAHIVKYVGDLEIARNLLLVPHPYALKDARAYLALCAKLSRQRTQKKYRFALELKSERHFIGFIGIREIDAFNGTATLGYWLARPYHRQGLMSEALAAILKFAFTKLKLRRLNLTAFAENKASNALIKKMGFTFEGRSKKSARDRATGTIHDENFYGLLKTDWLKHRAATRRAAP